MTIDEMNEKYITECHFSVFESPKTKSNHCLVNKDGRKILPKNSPFAAYERNIVECIYSQVGEKVFRDKVICHIDVYFKHENRHPDLNNMPKSTCDGIEKSGLVLNDKSIVAIYFDEKYDYDNPRIEVHLYDANLFKPVFSVEKTGVESEFYDNDYLVKSEDVRKKKRKKKTSASCEVCGKTDVLGYMKAIPKTKPVKYICLKCSLLGANTSDI